MNSENPGSATSYTYDATSNRLTKVSGSTTTTTVPSTSNKISAVGGGSITYDSAGNFLTSCTQGYVWNAAGQLGESKISGSTVGTYTYNASNQRTKKVAGGNTTQYVYGLNGLLYGEYTSAGALIREYVYLNDAPLAQINAGTPEVLTYLHPDHLGTPKFGTNTGGTQVWAANADAFGVGTPSGVATVNLRMPGQYYDSESSLFYNWNRYYNPAFGRYISSDPIGLDGGLNTFNYAELSPLQYIDPEGLMVDVNINCINNGGDVLSCLPLMGGARGGGKAKASGAQQSSGTTGKANKVSDSCSAPDFIVSPGGVVYPIPQGAKSVAYPKGLSYQGGSGGSGLDPKVKGFRFSSPTTTGKYPYPQGRGSYNNKEGQTVNPSTGQTISRSDPWAHIPGGK